MNLFKSTAILNLYAVAIMSSQAVADMEQASRQPSQGAEPVTISPAVTAEMKAGVYSTRAQTKAAIRDLAKRQGVALNKVKTVRVENITWPDGSLGCPQKGMSYTQAEVPGVLIVLSVEGTSHEYHAGNGNPPVYCANPSLPVSLVK